MTRSVLHNIYWIWLMMVCWQLGTAQTTNPFELPARVKQETPAVISNQTATHSVVAPVTPTNTNPFDLNRTSMATHEPMVTDVPSPVVSPTEPPNVTTPTTARFEQVVFIILVILGVLYTIALILFRSFFKKTWQSFLNDNMISQIHREQRAVADVPYLVLNVLSFLSLGLLAMLVLQHYEWSIHPSAWQQWWYLSLGFSVIFIAKHALLKIIGYTFPIAKEVRLYAFTITIFTAILGIIALFSSILIAYLPAKAPQLFIYLTGVVIAVLYAYRYLRGLFIGAKFVSGNFFHFLLYICAAEIVPVLLLVKFVQTVM